MKLRFHTSLCRTTWIHSIRTRRFLAKQKDLRNDLLKLVLFIFPQNNSLFGGVALFDRGVWDFVSIFLSETVASPRQKGRRKASMINTSKPLCFGRVIEKKSLFKPPNV